MLNRPALDLLQNQKNLVGVEIGVERGNNALNILQTLDIKTLYLVDPFCFIYDTDGNLVEEKSGANAIEGEARYLLTPFSDKIVWIKGYSTEVLDQIPNNIDFVYIDGNHSYEYVKRDIECYYPKVKDLGIIGGHDLDNPNVRKAVLQIFNSLSYNEVASSKSRDCRAYDWWVLKDEPWQSQIQNPNYKKHITFHGNLLFSHKSHAHVTSGFIRNLIHEGNKVTQCVPSDSTSFNIQKKEHIQLRKIVSSTHVSTNYNIWTLPCGVTDLSSYDPNSKFNCFSYNDGHFLYPKEELERLLKTPCNYILRSGKDAARTIANQIKRPVYYMYDYGIDLETFNPKVEKGLTFDNKFVFMLTSQNLWNWDLRGTDIAIESFLEEFGEDKNVILLLKIGEGYEIIKESVLKHPNITFLPNVVSLDTMASLYRSTDCMLAPIRGSMWEAPVLQAMACGVPAIATNAGGPQTYIKDGETGLLLNYEWKSDAAGDKKGVMFPGEIWKEPSVLQFKWAMRYAVQNRQRTRQMGEAAAEYVKKYTQRYLATKLLEFFDGSNEFVIRPE